MQAALPSARAPLRSRAVVVVGGLVALFGYASAAFPMLAIPALTLGLIAYLAQPEGALAGVARRMLLVAVPFVLLGAVRFTVEEAAPGIVEGGQRALASRAIAKLRVLRFAQDVAREQAVWDHDGDGVGSALFLDELCGAVKVRGRVTAPRGLFEGKCELRATEQGTVLVEGGYAFVLYLPGGGGGAAVTGGDVDEEQAERRYYAYAWPLDGGHGERPAVFLDEHERILLFDNAAPGPRYLGLDHAPPFDAALRSPAWRPWRGKQPRATLPGDR